MIYRILLFGSIYLTMCSSTYSQIAKSDSIIFDIQKIINCGLNKEENIEFLKYEVYLDSKYVLEKPYRNKVINLLNGTIKCSRLLFTTRGGSKLRMSIFEYQDSITSLANYNKIKNIFTNSEVREVEVQFKSNFVFRYKNYLCISYFFSEEFSEQVKELTGKSPLYVIKENKHYRK